MLFLFSCSFLTKKCQVKQKMVLMMILLLSVGIILSKYSPLKLWIRRLYMQTFLFGHSGLARINSIKLALANIIKYPILGLGYGSVSVPSLPILVLANTGVIGFAPFLLFNVIPLFRTLKLLSHASLKTEDLGLLLGIAGAFVSVLVALSISTTFAGLMYYEYWFILCGLTAITRRCQLESTKTA